jgi:hypothetical protein
MGVFIQWGMLRYAFLEKKNKRQQFDENFKKVMYEICT